MCNVLFKDISALDARVHHLNWWQLNDMTNFHICLWGLDRSWVETFMILSLTKCSSRHVSKLVDQNPSMTLDRSISYCLSTKTLFKSSLDGLNWAISLFLQQWKLSVMIWVNLSVFIQWLSFCTYLFQISSTPFLWQSKRYLNFSIGSIKHACVCIIVVASISGAIADYHNWVKDDII